MYLLCHVELELELFWRVVKVEWLAGVVEVDATYYIR
jgi:hypothetical protein